MATGHTMNPEDAEVFRGKSSGDETPRLEPDLGNYPFLYVHYEKSWSFEDGFGFMPSLGQMTMRPAANGVYANGDSSFAVQAVIRKGGVVIMPADKRLGSYANYLISYATRNRALPKHYCFKFESFRNMRSGRSIPNGCPEKFREFRVQIRDHIIEPLLPAVYDELLEREVAKVDRASQAVAKNAITKEQYKVVLDRLAAFEEAWEVYKVEHYGETYTPEPASTEPEVATVALGDLGLDDETIKAAKASNEPKTRLSRSKAAIAARAEAAAAAAAAEGHTLTPKASE